MTTPAGKTAIKAEPAAKAEPGAAKAEIEKAKKEKSFAASNGIIISIPRCLNTLKNCLNDPNIKVQLQKLRAQKKDLKKKVTAKTASEDEVKSLGELAASITALGQKCIRIGSGCEVVLARIMTDLVTDLVTHSMRTALGNERKMVDTDSLFSKISETDYWGLIRLTPIVRTFSEEADQAFRKTRAAARAQDLENRKKAKEANKEVPDLKKQPGDNLQFLLYGGNVIKAVKDTVATEKLDEKGEVVMQETELLNEKGEAVKATVPVMEYIYKKARMSVRLREIFAIIIEECIHVLSTQLRFLTDKLMEVRTLNPLHIVLFIRHLLALEIGDQKAEQLVQPAVAVLEQYTKHLAEDKEKKTVARAEKIKNMTAEEKKVFEEKELEAKKRLLEETRVKQAKKIKAATKMAEEAKTLAQNIEALAKETK